MKTIRRNITLKEQAQLDILELRRNRPQLEGVVSVIDHTLAVTRHIQCEHPILYREIVDTLEEEEEDGND